MQITKAQVIQALKKEPLLKANEWAHPVRDNCGFIAYFRPDCPVCAVGAVLRQVVKLKNDEIALEANRITRSAPITSGESIDRLLDQGFYLNALSCYFEDAVNRVYGRDYEDRKDHNDVRWETIAFVEKSFPEGVIYED